MSRRFTIFILLTITVACRTSAPLTPLEDQIEQRDHSFNGIVVGAPKLYDDSVLQQMLTAAETRLSQIQVLDQSGITGKIGTLTGASQTFSGTNVQLLGLPAPQVATTANGATQQTTDVTKASGDNSTTIVSGVPVQNVVTTAPQVTATAPTAPGPSVTLPTTFSPSASDILNEQLQLTFEIANLRLLIDGSFNERFLINGSHRFVRPRVTVGFPIAITPDARYRDAVAIAEIEVETDRRNDLSEHGEAPIVTALLPREKTYNVASITEQSTSIGGGIVTHVASVGASFLHGQKTFYVVQDQDTVALPLQTADETEGRSVRFAWQFRPVLGQRFVRAGLKQTFVQLAFPSPADADLFGKVCIKTYWRRYDRGRNVVTDIVPGSLRTYTKPIDIPGFDLTPNLGEFNRNSFEDLGNGAMLVKVPGRFLPGTMVRIGPDILQPGPRMTLDDRLLRFTAPIFDLATKQVVIVNRDGTETPLVIKSADIVVGDLKLKQPVLEPIDDVTSKLTLPVTPILSDFPLVVVIGNRAFGYSDAPVTRSGDTVTVAVPTALANANRSVTVRPLFVDFRYHDTKEILAQDAVVERLDVIDRGKKVKYLLYGRHLDGVGVVVPENAKLEVIGKGEDNGTLRLLEVDGDTGKSLKQLVLQKKGNRPFVVDVPPPPPDPKPDTKPTSNPS